MKNIAVLCILSISFFNLAFAQTGAELFRSKCMSCHTIGNGRLVGPDLKGAMRKYKEDWLIKWIRSSQTLVNDGDPIAKALFEQYNEIQMTDVDLTDEQIKSVIAYVREQSGEAVATATAANDAVPAADKKAEETQTAVSATAASGASAPANVASSSNENSQPAATNNNSATKSAFTMDTPTIIISAAAIVIMITIVILSKTIMTLSKILREKAARESEVKQAA